MKFSLHYGNSHSPEKPSARKNDRQWVNVIVKLVPRLLASSRLNHPLVAVSIAGSTRAFRVRRRRMMIAVSLDPNPPGKVGLRILGYAV